MTDTVNNSAVPTASRDGGLRILVGVGGGIAAFKALDLVRRLRERGARVRVVLTRAATEFVTPLSAASLSGEPVHLDLFSLTDEARMGHIELSRDADLVLIAPATADLLAKAASGLAGWWVMTTVLPPCGTANAASSPSRSVRCAAIASAGCHAWPSARLIEPRYSREPVTGSVIRAAA